MLHPKRIIPRKRRARFKIKYLRKDLPEVNCELGWETLDHTVRNAIFDFQNTHPIKNYIITKIFKNKKLVFDIEKNDDYWKLITKEN